MEKHLQQNIKHHKPEKVSLTDKKIAYGFL